MWFWHVLLVGSGIGGHLLTDFKENTKLGLHIITRSTKLKHTLKMHKYIMVQSFWLWQWNAAILTVMGRNCICTLHTHIFIAITIGLGYLMDFRNMNCNPLHYFELISSVRSSSRHKKLCDIRNVLRAQENTIIGNTTQTDCGK